MRHASFFATRTSAISLAEMHGRELVAGQRDGGLVPGSAHMRFMRSIEHAAVGLAAYLPYCADPRYFAALPGRRAEV